MSCMWKKVENHRQCTQGCGELGPPAQPGPGSRKGSCPGAPTARPPTCWGPWAPPPPRPTSLLAGTGALATDMPHSLLSQGTQQTHPWAAVTSPLFLGGVHTGLGEGNGNPLQYSCLENPKDGGAWWAAVYGVAQSQTRLKLLSSSSSSSIQAYHTKKASHGQASTS